MRKFKNNEQGFGSVEALMIVIIVVLVGAVGYLVYKNNHKTTAKTVVVTKNVTVAPKSTTSNEKTYTDPSSIYYLVYPNSWTVSQVGAGDQPPATVINKLATTFTAPGAPNSGLGVPNHIQVVAYQSSDTSGILKFYQSGDQHTTPQNLTINGYQAIYQQSSESQPTTYTDNSYAVTHNGVTIAINFRDKQGAQTYPATPSDNTPAFDDSSLLPSYTALVKSIKFLN